MAAAYWVQASLNAGYFLFPHQTFRSDSFALPSYCKRNGHAGVVAEPWDALTKHSGTFAAGDRVIFYQSGQPEWLTGVWGYGTVEKDEAEVRLRPNRMLQTPLFLSKRAARRLGTHLLRGLLGKGGVTYRGTYATIGNDFEILKRHIDNLPAAELGSFRRENRPAWRDGKTARQCFERWLAGKGWEWVTRGFPDVLAATPNRRVLAFEGKRGSEGPSPEQERTFDILRSKGLTVSLVRDVANADIASDLAESGWEPLSVGTVTKGWPDYLLIDRTGERLVACEFKTGPSEKVSVEQMKTLSTMATVLGIETHVVRTIQRGSDSAWSLYDDSERWLLYPPMPAPHFE